MGHYASEMNGANFNRSIDLPKQLREKVGELLLKKNKIKYKSITNVFIDSINPYSYTRRAWIEVGFVGRQAWQGEGEATWNCRFTCDIEETKKLLTQEEIYEINKLIDKL